MRGCLSHEEAHDLVGGTLAPLQREAAEAHAHDCAACQLLLKAVAERGQRSCDGEPRRRTPLTERFRGNERFEIIRPLGQGGMGVVYEAHDRESDSIVALKMLNRLDGHSLYLFKKEFRELAHVRHPNLLRLGELHCVDERWFFTMELIRGHDFVEHVRGKSGSDATAVADVGTRAGGFDELKLRAALRQLVEGVHALHESGHIHRDIKPSNILVTDEGRVVLLDFGLVQRLDKEDPSSDTVHGIAGTAAYMAPEQAAEGPVGPAADWYAVGVVLFKALTGTLPFSGPALQVMLEKQSREPMPTNQIVGDVPSDLDALTQMLLRCQPAERPSGAEILQLIGATGSPALPAQSSAPASRRAVPVVGRDAELSALGDAFSASQSGGATAVLVQGEPGIGKTAVVERFLEQARVEWPEIVVLRGRCYEQETVPFNAFDGIIDALSHYLKQLDEVVAAALLPPNIQLLAGMFPVLRRVPVVSRIAPGRRRIDNPEQRRRHAFAVMRELFDALASRVPLVLFADDLQWADRDSLALLDALLAPPDAPPLMLVATLRSSPIGDGTATTMPPSLRARFRELSLARLSPTDSADLVARLLAGTGPADPAETAALVGESGGHPLFLQELVRHVGTPGAATRHVTLDDMLFRRVSGLDEPALRLMEILAVAGVPLKVGVVASAAELTPAECVRWLRTLRAVQLVRVDGFGADRTVQTFHDRVRETIVNRVKRGAYARLSLLELARVHLRIGRQVLQQSRKDEIDDGIFNIAHHLNLGAALIDDPEERQKLVELNLSAGRKALLSTAYAAALPFLRQAAQLLRDPDDWTIDYALKLAVHREWMACEHMTGNVERAAALYQSLIEHAADELDAAEVQLLWIQLATSAGRFAEAIATGRAALRALDVGLPARSGKAAVLVEHARLQWYLGHRRADELDELPESGDARMRMVLELLVALCPAAFFADIQLMTVCLVRVAQLSLKHGVASVSSFGFAGYGSVLVAGFGRHEEGYAFGQLALRLNERFQDDRLLCKVLFQNGTFLTGWVRPFAEAKEQLDQACVEGARAGDIAYEAYAAATRSLICYCGATDLRGMQDYGERARAIAKSRREDDMAGIGAAVARFAAALRSSREPVPTLSTPESSDAAFLATLDPARMPITRLYYFLLNAELAYLFGDYARASDLLRQAARRLAFAFSIPTTLEFALLEALVVAQLYPAASWRHRLTLARVLARQLRQLQTCARTAPSNFEPGYLIARAEAERIAGRRDLALAGYKAAARAAVAYGRPKRAGLALELMARLCSDEDRQAALTYARQAIAQWEKFGASAKAAQLLREFEPEIAVASHAHVG
jgi:predicted ATPase